MKVCNFPLYLSER